MATPVPSSMVVVRVVVKPGCKMLLTNFLTLDHNSSLLGVFSDVVAAELRKSKKAYGDLARTVRKTQCRMNINIRTS
jgi:hypothetical protein